MSNVVSSCQLMLNKSSYNNNNINNNNCDDDNDDNAVEAIYNHYFDELVI